MRSLLPGLQPVSSSSSKYLPPCADGGTTCLLRQSKNAYCDKDKILLVSGTIRAVLLVLYVLAGIAVLAVLRALLNSLLVLILVQIRKGGVFRTIFMWYVGNLLRILWEQVREWSRKSREMCIELIYHWTSLSKLDSGSYTTIASRRNKT